jgi:hypothetical protein
MEALPVVKKRIVALPRVNPKSKLNVDNTVFMLSFWILSQKIYSHQLTKDEVNQLTKTGHCYLPVKESMFQIMKLSFQNDKKFSQKLRSIRQKNTTTHGTTNNNSNAVSTSTTSTSSATNNKESGTTIGETDQHNTTTSNNINKKNNATSDSNSTDPLVVAKIHCIRLDTNQTCTLYHSNLPRFEMQRSYANSDEVRFPVQRALSNTDAGDQLVAEWFHGWPEGIRNFGGLTFCVKLTKEKIHVESIVFGAPGQSDHLKSRNGVSPFHIIEGLAGWQ